MVGRANLTIKPLVNGVKRFRADVPLAQEEIIVAIPPLDASA